MSKKSRIFVGLPVSNKLQKRIRLSLKKHFKNFSLRIIKPENLHITIIPPWYVEDYSEDKKRLEIVKIKHDPFNIIFNRVEFGPDPRKPRLVWATGKRNENIIKLRKKLFEIYDKRLPKRNFVSHITMARFNQKDFKDFPVKKFSKKIDWREEIGSVCLYESILKRSGAEYKIITRVGL